MNARLSERTTAALAHKKRNGERTGGIPFGFKLAGDGVQLVAIEAEQAVIADIRAMRQAGKSYRAIADALTERGVATKKGNGCWSHTAVAGIVKRRTGREA